MPFTLVHPAAVLPLARSPLVPAALVAGAVAPDVTYYVPLTWIHGNLNLTLTHTWSSVLWVDPAIALVLLAVGVLLARPVVSLLPRQLAGRLLPRLDAPVRLGPTRAAWVLVSTALGAATHLAWDALDGWLGGGESTVPDLVSDVLGAVVLVLWGRSWWRRTSPRPVGPPDVLGIRTRALAVVAAAAATAVWVVARGIGTAVTVGDDLRSYGAYSGRTVAEYVVRGAAVDAVVAVVVLLLVHGVAWHARRVLRGRVGARGSG